MNPFFQNKFLNPKNMPKKFFFQKKALKNDFENCADV